MTIKFKESRGFTVGIEIELQLLDSDTLSLVDTSPAIIDGLDGMDGAVKHEFLLSNIEINTGISRTVAGAGAELYQNLDLLIKEASRHQTLIGTGGTHPFSPWRDQTVTDTPRYRRLKRTLQIVSRRFNIFGLHVHVGLADGDRCIYIMNRMLFYIPHLLALSANSPFWEGEDTGLKSYRSIVFDSLPIAGLPFYFRDWSEYVSLVENYVATGTIETIREIWWDIRPHPDFGTIEVRICDMPLTIREVLALAALIQALVKRFDAEYETGGQKQSRPHSAVIRENRWRAGRYGLEGEFITEDGRKTLHARDAVAGLVDSLGAEAGELGNSAELDCIREILDSGEGARRQRRLLEQRGGLREVVGEISESLTEEVKQGHG